MKKTLQRLFTTLAENVPDVPFAVHFWDGDCFSSGSGTPAFTIGFRTERAAGNVFAKGTLGFGEEYVDGNITVDGDFRELMRLGMDPHFQYLKISPGVKLAVFAQYLRSLNTQKGSARNVVHHYNRGNDLYRLYLDETLTYSCAYFRTPGDTLEAAQQQKYEHICRKLKLKEGETLVDIGCGWGGMLIYAAEHYGTKGLGCSLSPEQVDLAKERVRDAGLEKKIEILLEDYRNIKGPFDKFVSIGMFEHVGKGFIPLYIEKMRDMLKPEGAGLLHTIGKERETPADPWIRKYIFPGTHLPVLGSVLGIMGEKGLVPLDVENLRLHYALTLEEWARRFEKNVEKIKEMFGEKFVRMWRIYLNGSAAAFRSGEIRLYQILFTKGLNNRFPITRDHVYNTV